MRLKNKVINFFIVLTLVYATSLPFFIRQAWAVSDVSIALLPNDPEYFRQWYLPHIRAAQAWEYIQGSPEVVIAVLDTGVDIDHPDLQNNIWINKQERPYDQIDNDGNGYVDDFYGWNFVDNTNNISPNLNGGEAIAVHHGTIVAGALGAQGDNLKGIAGVNWRVRIMPLTVLDNHGQGNSYNVANAINYAVAMGADVINLSFVGTEYLDLLQSAIYNAYINDVVVVAAAGNEADHGIDMDLEPAYPVCYDSRDNIIIGVAAVDQNNKILSSSNYGVNCIDVVAPGSDFFSTIVYEPNNESYKGLYRGGWNGTSVSAPLVSGLAGLIKALNPHLKAGQIRNIIVNTAQSVDSYNSDEYKGKLGAGLIDANMALKAAQATVIGGQSQAVRQEFFVFSPGESGGPHIRLLDYQGNVLSQFFAWESNFRGGVNIATGDVDGDGRVDVVAAVKSDHKPEVKIFDSAGNLKYEFMAYHQNFRGGVNVAVGDIDNDGKAEIITGAGPGGGPHVRVFDYQGQALSGFMAYNQNFRGGVNVAVGDIDNDGKAEIITGAGPGGGPHVRVFDSIGLIKSEFMSYALNFTGGVNVATGDVDNNGHSEIITAPYSAGGPHIRVFSSQGKLKSQWFAGDHNFRNGLNLAVGDLTGNGLQQLIIGQGKNSQPIVMVYDWLGNLQKSLLVYNPNFHGGVDVAIFKK